MCQNEFMHSLMFESVDFVLDTFVSLRFHVPKFEYALCCIVKQVKHIPTYVKIEQWQMSSTNSVNKWQMDSTALGSQRGGMGKGRGGNGGGGKCYPRSVVQMKRDNKKCKAKTRLGFAMMVYFLLSNNLKWFQGHRVSFGSRALLNYQTGDKLEKGAHGLKHDSPDRKAWQPRQEGCFSDK